MNEKTSNYECLYISSKMFEVFHPYDHAKILGIMLQCSRCLSLVGSIEFINWLNYLNRFIRIQVEI